MRLLRALASFVLLLVLSGCGYIHFGRLPKAGPNDAALERAYSDLATEHKILKQELVLARRETDTLRSALEKSVGSPAAPAPEMAKQLEDTTRELATLRVSYAKLRAEREGPAAAATSATDVQLAETQEKLTTTQREYAQLQDENAHLRHDLEATRSENATLARQLKTSVTEAEQAQASVSQLSTEVEAQKRARERAEQATGALRAQLEAVLARAERAESAHASEAPTAKSEPPVAEPTAAASPIPAPVSPVASLAALQRAKAPPSGAVPTVELRSNGGRARGTGGTAVAPSVAGSNTSESQPAEPTAVTSATTPPTTAPEMPIPSSTPSPVAASPAASAATPEVATATPSTSASNNSTTPAPAARTYTVQRGDTLEKISQHFYGAADQWGKIYAANADALSASGGLKPGMELQIPEK